jgi:hypothetical protein
MTKQTTTRRAMIAGLGVAAAGALARPAHAQGAQTPAPYAPTLHAEDDWMSAVKGQHRVVLDVTSPEHIPDGLRFAGNLLSAHKSGYGVEESDVAILICLRHSATAYGYGDAIWSKYGGTFDAEATPAPTANPFNSGGRAQMADLARRGVRFMVCGVASRGLAGRVAGRGGDVDAVLNEFGANLIPNARIVPAGVIGVTHAQERGFAMLYVG